MVVFLPKVQLNSRNKEWEGKGDPVGQTSEDGKGRRGGHTSYKTELFRLQAAWDGLGVEGDEGVALERQT